MREAAETPGGEREGKGREATRRLCSMETRYDGAVLCLGVSESGVMLCTFKYMVGMNLYVCCLCLLAHTFSSANAYAHAHTQTPHIHTKY